jgi:hypothetical protein
MHRSWKMGPLWQHKKVLTSDHYLGWEAIEYHATLVAVYMPWEFPGYFFHERLLQALTWAAEQQTVGGLRRLLSQSYWAKHITHPSRSHWHCRIDSEVSLKPMEPIPRSHRDPGIWSHGLIETPEANYYLKYLSKFEAKCKTALAHDSGPKEGLFDEKNRG